VSVVDGNKLTVEFDRPARSEWWTASSRPPDAIPPLQCSKSGVGLVMARLAKALEEQLLENNPEFKAGFTSGCALDS
jgi:hypothetical protein